MVAAPYVPTTTREVGPSRGLMLSRDWRPPPQKKLQWGGGRGHAACLLLAGDWQRPVLQPAPASVVASAGSGGSRRDTTCALVPSGSEPLVTGRRQGRLLCLLSVIAMQGAHGAKGAWDPLRTQSHRTPPSWLSMLAGPCSSSGGTASLPQHQPSHAVT